VQKIDVILRTFNNPDILNILQQLQNIKNIDKTIVIINKLKDKIDSKNLILSKYPKVKIVELVNYGWSKALNAGIKISLNNKSSKYILIVSNEVKIKQSYIDELIKMHQLYSNISASYMQFKDRDEFNYKIPRNTAILWKKEIFTKVGFFNENLDTKGGMEDFELILRAYKRLNLIPYLIEQKTTIDIKSKKQLQKKLKNELSSIYYILEHI